MELQQYSMLMQLSQFSSFIIPLKVEIYIYPIRINFIK